MVKKGVAVVGVVFFLIVTGLIVWGLMVKPQWWGFFSEEGEECEPYDDDKIDNADKYTLNEDLECKLLKSCKTGWNIDSATSNVCVNTAAAAAEADAAAQKIIDDACSPDAKELLGDDVDTYALGSTGECVAATCTSPTYSVIDGKCLTDHCVQLGQTVPSDAIWLGGDTATPPGYNINSLATIRAANKAKTLKDTSGVAITATYKYLYVTVSNGGAADCNYFLILSNTAPDAAADEADVHCSYRNKTYDFDAGTKGDTTCTTLDGGRPESTEHPGGAVWKVYEL